MAASMSNMIRGGCSVVFQQRSSIQRFVGPLINFTPVCHSSRKHYNPRFRRLRREKSMFVPREKKDKTLSRMRNMTMDEKRMEFKKMGMPHGNRLRTREINLASTEEVFDPYVPREGKGKTSILSLKDFNQAKERSKEKIKFIGKFRAKGKIANFEQDFSYDAIAPELQNIYIESQKLLTDFQKNKEALFDYVTMLAYKKMTYKLDTATVKWEFVESLEPPRVVHATVQEVALKENFYAQVTLRVHLRQKMAIYDRFGRLMYGDPDLVKNVLEYIVFENRIVSVLSRWRVHDKVIPEWESEEEAVLKTYVEEPLIDLDKDKDSDKETDEKKEEKEEKLKEKERSHL